MLKFQKNVGPLTMDEVEKANNYLVIKVYKGVDLNSIEA